MSQQKRSVLLCAARGPRRDSLAALIDRTGLARHNLLPEDPQPIGERSIPENVSVVLVDLEDGCPIAPESLAELRRSDRLRDARVIHLLPRHGGEDAPAADYSLKEPLRDSHLTAIIRAASTEYERTKSLRQDVRDRSSAIGTIVRGRFEIRTPKEARNLAAMLSFACPEPEAAAIALSELLINAIEHGNLEIGFDDKSELLANGAWESEITRRLELPDYAARRVKIDFARREACLNVRIADEGKGFDYKKYLEGTVNNFRSPHGRGIFLARAACFSSLHYEGCGNVAVAEIELS